MVDRRTDRRELEPIAQTDDHTPEPTHHLWCFALFERMLVCPEDFVFNPMQIVFYTPVMVEMLGYFLSCEPSAGNETDGLIDLVDSTILTRSSARSVKNAHGLYPIPVITPGQGWQEFLAFVRDTDQRYRRRDVPSS